MLEELDFITFFGPAILLASLVLLIMAYFRSRKKDTAINKAIDHFKITTIVFGILIVILLLSLPSTPSLKTFGYPATIEEINGDKKILRLLQTYNKAIARTTEVLHWFLFLFTWWFLSTLFVLVNAFKSDKKQSFEQL